MPCGMAKKKKERYWWPGFFVQTGERLELMKMDVMRKVPQLARPACDLLFALGLLVPGSSSHWPCLTEKQTNENQIVLNTYLPCCSYVCISPFLGEELEMNLSSAQVGAHTIQVNGI